MVLGFDSNLSVEDIIDITLSTAKEFKNTYVHPEETVVAEYYIVVLFKEGYLVVGSTDRGLNALIPGTLEEDVLYNKLFITHTSDALKYVEPFIETLKQKLEVA